MSSESREFKLAADRMLGRLARWLRLAGLDVIWSPELGGHVLLRLARSQGRIMLTRDQRLATAQDVIVLKTQSFREQLDEVRQRLSLCVIPTLLTRCSRCNGLLRRVAKDTIAHLVPPFVYASHDEFLICPDCGRIYWKGSHAERILGEISKAFGSHS